MRVRYDDALALCALFVLVRYGAPWPRRRRRDHREPITARAIRFGSLVVSRTSAGGRRVARAAHRSRCGSKDRPPVQIAEPHGAPALTNVPPSTSSSPAPAGLADLEAVLDEHLDALAAELAIPRPLLGAVHLGGPA